MLGWIETLKSAIAAKIACLMVVFYISEMRSIGDEARVVLWISSQSGSLSFLQCRPGRMHMPQMTRRRSEQIHSA